MDNEFKDPVAYPMPGTSPEWEMPAFCHDRVEDPDTVLVKQFRTGGPSFNAAGKTQSLNDLGGLTKKLSEESISKVVGKLKTGESEQEYMTRKIVKLKRNERRVAGDPAMEIENGGNDYSRQNDNDTMYKEENPSANEEGDDLFHVGNENPGPVEKTEDDDDDDAFSIFQCIDGVER